MFLRELRYIYTSLWFMGADLVIFIKEERIKETRITSKKIEFWNAKIEFVKEQVWWLLRMNLQKNRFDDT